MRFSIIVVSLNSGQRLNDTLSSINKQTFKDFEVVIKDGMSVDGSTECVGSYKELNINMITEKDSGIYDAMNKAVSYATGDYVYFLNCGDLFASDDVLMKVAEAIKDGCGDIYYGNIYEQLTQKTVTSNPKIDAFACYRNVPCHQACFFPRKIMLEYPFETKYRVRADYEQFLRCYFKAGVAMHYMDFAIAAYEGGGFSETENGLKMSKQEHRIISKIYFTNTQLFKYKAIMILTLSSLRTAMAKNPKFAGFYNSLKNLCYKRKKK